MNLPDWFDIINFPISRPEKTTFISSPSYVKTRIFEMKTNLTGIQNIGKTIYEYSSMSRFLPGLIKYFKNLPFSGNIENISFKSYLEKTPIL